MAPAALAALLTPRTENARRDSESHFGLTWEIAVIVILVLVLSSILAVVIFSRLRRRNRRQAEQYQYAGSAAAAAHDMSLAAGAAPASSRHERRTSTNWRDSASVSPPPSARTSYRAAPAYAPPALPYGLGGRATPPARSPAPSHHRKSVLSEKHRP